MKIKLYFVTDIFSTIAYQGGGRDLDDKDIEGMIKMLKLPIPDLTILLDVPVETGLMRAKERSELDRFEKEDIDFHKKIRQSYKRKSLRRDKS